MSLSPSFSYANDSRKTTSYTSGYALLEKRGSSVQIPLLHYSALLNLVTHALYPHRNHLQYRCPLSSTPPELQLQHKQNLGHSDRNG